MTDAAIAELADRLAIQDLIARYPLAVDGQDWDALDELFVPDARIDFTAFGLELTGLDIVCTSFDRDHRLAFGYEPAYYLNGLFKNSTWISAKIKDQVLHSLFSQVANCFVKFRNRGLLKATGESDVSNTVW